MSENKYLDDTEKVISWWVKIRESWVNELHRLDLVDLAGRDIAEIGAVRREITRYWRNASASV